MNTTKKKQAPRYTGQISGYQRGEGKGWFNSILNFKENNRMSIYIFII